MRLSFRSFTDNWQLKLAAFSLAILLWVVVSAEQITTQWIPVPVRVMARDPDFVVTGGPVPREVDVRFAGPGRELWELAIDRPVLVLPLDDMEGEREAFDLDPRMVRIPNGISSVTPLDVRPGRVRVVSQPLVTREVPVQVRIARRSQERYVLLEPPEVRPATVRVSGRADRVARLEAVPTEPIDLAGADTAFQQVVPLALDSLPGVRPSPQAVRVSGRVDRLVERILPSVAVAPVPGATVTPERVDVRVQGPARLVRAIDPDALRVEVVAGSLPAALPPAGASVPVRVTGLPPGLETRTVPVMVRVAPPAGEAPAPPDTAAPPPEEIVP